MSGLGGNVRFWGNLLASMSVFWNGFTALATKRLSKLRLLPVHFPRTISLPAIARVVLVAFVAASASCSTKTQVEEATEAGILLFGNSNEPKGLDPHQVSGVLESNIIRAIYEGLCVEHQKEDGVATPGVAKTWTPNDDFTEWVFELREDAKWSDGEPVTAEDFLFAFRRILTPELASDYSFMLYYIRDAEPLHKGQRSYLLCRNDSNIPVAWESLSKVNFGGVEGDPSPFKKAGLDFLDAGELQQLLDDPSKFEWPDAVPTEARSYLIQKNLEFVKSGNSLWDLADFGASAPDSHTLKVELRGPLPFLPELTKHYTWFPVPKHIVLKHGSLDDPFNPWASEKNIVSNGAFKMKTWRFNDHIEVERNPHYWDAETVGLNGIRYLPVKNSYTEARMFFNDQMHITYTLPPELMGFAAENFKDDLRNELYLGTRFMRVNVKRDGLTDARVRQALSLALDTQSLIDNVLQGGQKPAYSIVPPTGSYNTPKVIEYDPEKAKQLMAEAGYPGGKGFPELNLLTTDRDIAKRMAEAYQAMWKETLGIKVGIRQMEWTSYLTTMFEKEYDIAASGWIGDYLDPTTFLDMWVKDGGNNNTNWSSAEYEALLRKAENTADPNARYRILEQAEAIMMDDRPVIPVYWYTRNYLVKPDVSGWHPLLLDNHPFKFIRLKAPTD